MAAELQQHEEALWACVPALASANVDTRGQILAGIVFDAADTNQVPPLGLPACRDGMLRLGWGRQDGVLSHSELKRFLRGNTRVAQLVRPLHWQE